MTSHKGDFSQIQGVGVEIRGVRRMYEWMMNTRTEARINRPREVLSFPSVASGPRDT